MSMEYKPPLEIIGKVATFLGSPLPYANRDDLKAHLVGLEALGMELAKTRTDWLKTLHEAENNVLYPKDKDFTELDRRVRLQAAVAEIKRDYDYLVALEELTARRLELGRLLLA
jgi:hypothetical protein